MCLNQKYYRDGSRPRMDDDEQYVRGLQEGIDIGLMRGIEKGLEKGAEAKAGMVRQKLQARGFGADFIREIVGDL